MPRKKTTSGQRDPFGPFREVFARWKDLHEAYIKADPKDPAYWNCEITNCSLLATAAYLVGGRGLVEVAMDRICDGDNGNGRVDIWMELPGLEPGSHPVTCVAEAKQRFLTWQPGRASTTAAARKVVYLMEEAEASLRSLDFSWDSENGTSKLAIVFVVPKVSEQEPQRELTEKIRRGMRDCHIETVSCDPAPRWHNYHYPGIMLVARCLKRLGSR